MATARYTDLTLYRRLLREARPYGLHIAGIFLLSLLSTPLALLAPLPLKIAVDSILGSHPLPGFLRALVPPAAAHSSLAAPAVTAALVVGIALLSSVQSLGSWLLQTYTGEKLTLEFRAQLFRHVQRLSLGYHDTRGTTDSIYRIQNDARAVQSIAVSGVMPFIAEGVTLAGMIGVTARLDRPLALVALAVTPVLFFLIRGSRPRLRDRWSDVKQRESAAMSVVQEALTSLRVVKAFAREEYEQDRFVRQSNRLLRGRLEVAFVQSGFEILVGLTLAAGTAAALFLGVLHVRSGALTLGELLLVMAYLAQLYSPLKSISGRLTDLQSSLASAERAFSLLDEAPDVAERPNARPLGRARGAVSFESVSFSYDPERPVLHEVSCEIRPGTRVGIAGTTGAGKTTFVSLLTRFYDPTAGRILLDGEDLRDYRVADLRNQFAIVLQESVLFSTSIAENIAYGRPGATEPEIVQAAKAANAHDFIARLPEGYETQVGERGMCLSGGERQRIALARAFLKDAPILILDEPTSSVDTKTEAAIMEAMERLMHGRTSFMISHRPSTLSNCDLLLKIERGRLVEVTQTALATAREGRVFGALDSSLEGSNAGRKG